MTTTLQMCKDVCREAGVPGGEAAITTIIGQKGDLARIVKFVIDEWEEIQNSEQAMWRWNRITATYEVPASTNGTYAPALFTDTLTTNLIDRFLRWRIDDIDDPAKSFLVTSTEGSQYWLSWMPWNMFKSIYRIGTQNDSLPAHISIDPQDNIVLGPIPLDPTNITVDYYRSPQILAVNGDVPEMPIQYHKLITWRALEQYGIYKIKKEAILKGIKKGGIVYKQLKRNQLPRFRLGAPLVA